MIPGICGDNSLLNAEGFMCCLGFCAIQSGVREEAIFDHNYPGCLDKKCKGLNEFREGEIKDTVFSSEAAEINDADDITEANREKELKELAKEHGYRFAFTGTTPKEYWS